MDIQFTEAWYSPKSKQLVLLLRKEPPNRIAPIFKWSCSCNNCVYVNYVSELFEIKDVWITF